MTKDVSELVRHFKSGAVRHELKQGDTEIRWDLLPMAQLRRVAIVYGEGAKLFSDNNWKKGFPIKATLSHLIEHLYKYMEGQQDEDHLAKVVWNTLAIMWEEDHKKSEHASIASYPNCCGARPPEKQHSITELPEDCADKNLHPFMD